MISTFRNFAKIALTTFALTMAQNTYALVEGPLPERFAAQARTTLQSINAQINYAVSEARKSYEDRLTNELPAFVATPSAVIKNLLTSSGADHRLEILNITDARTVQIKFLGTGMGKREESTLKAPIFSQLLGKRIVLVPVVDSTALNNSIGSFECLTDADEKFADAEGVVTTTKGERSFISSYSTNSYLGSCQYTDAATLDSLWKS
jgi:hypothetical protein